jgi:hypothetical protein
VSGEARAGISNDGVMSMSTSVAKKLVLGTAVGAVALLGALAPAMAHGKHRHHFRVWSPPVVTYYRGGCDYYYWKWQRTGSKFWKYKYYDCAY